MENSNQYSSEDLQKCPFHNQQNTAEDKNQTHENANDSDDAGTDPYRYSPEKFKKGINDTNASEVHENSNL